MILHLGVIDLPYQPPPSRGRPRKVATGTQTTGDVAGWLETRYHIFETFYELHKDDIAGDLENSAAGALENLLLGSPASAPDQVFATATSQIEDRFKRFLSDREMEALGYPGVPTQAALTGINHRLKSGRGPRRPSFISSGLFQASAKAWVD
jgi:hypothetical protein